MIELCEEKMDLGRQSVPVERSPLSGATQDFKIAMTNHGAFLMYIRSPTFFLCSVYESLCFSFLVNTNESGCGNIIYSCKESGFIQKWLQDYGSHMALKY